MKRYKGIEEYIADQPANTHAVLRKLKSIVVEVAPDSEEVEDATAPTYKVGGKKLVFFHVLKDHIGFYPDPETINHFEAKLGDYVSTKGAVNFPIDEEIPYNLVREMVEYRLANL